ncbi:exosporium leader peptide-containing protein, partial [Bacillus toyonensis]|uniref:exosporium leader peptide-containing protein n=1 Tax=Bacillus toyonensis TaxID=155322 RepID=UPI00352AA5D9
MKFIYRITVLIQYSTLIGGSYVFDKNEILQVNALNPNLIGPTLPPIPPFTLPTGPTGPTG